MFQAIKSKKPAVASVCMHYGKRELLVKISAYLVLQPYITETAKMINFV